MSCLARSVSFTRLSQTHVQIARVHTRLAPSLHFGIADPLSFANPPPEPTSPKRGQSTYATTLMVTRVLIPAPESSVCTRELIGRY